MTITPIFTAPQSNQTNPANATAATGATPANDLFSLSEHFQTTPGRMQAFAVAIALFSLLLWLVAQGGITKARLAIQTIGRDSAPSIVAAEKINASLANMDANAANGFFTRGQEDANKQYAADQKNANDALITAAQNITFGDEERAPISDLTNGIQEYVGLIEQARQQGYPVGLGKLALASSKMHDMLLPKPLLPTAAKLDEVNFKHLDAAYKTDAESLTSLQFLIVAGGAALLAILIATQIFVLQKTRRLLNLPLLAATALTALLTLGMFVLLTVEKENLRAAKADGFDSIHVLWQARAAAFDANGDESRYLLQNELEPGLRASKRAQYTQQFQEKSMLLAALGNEPLRAVVYAPAPGQKTVFTGLLAKELNNITFRGEKEAAEAMMRDYSVYMNIDGEIRRLEEAGQHEAAVRLCTGVAENQSNGAFNKFDKSLGDVLKINQDEFDQRVEGAFVPLKQALFAAPIFALAIALLSWYGLNLRIREYAA